MHSRKRFRTFLLGGLAVLVLGALLTAVLFVRARRAETQSGRLGQAQWNRLVTKLRAREAPPPPAVVSTPEPVPAPDPSPPPPPPPPRERPTRPPLDDEARARQAEEYAADRRKTVVELQPFRTARSIDVAGAGGRSGVATLVNLNPAINVWYLLEVQWVGAPAPQLYHLANSRPARQDLDLDPTFPAGLVIADTLERVPCDLWSEAAPVPLEEAARSGSPYAVLCGEEVALRLKTAGRKTTLEWTTDFLRNNIWRGEAITVFARETFYQDAFLTTSQLLAGDDAGEPLRLEEPAGAPSPARLDPGVVGRLLVPTDLGLVLDNEVQGKVEVGRWYANRGNPGIFASVIRPDLVAPEILSGYRDVVNPLDEVERQALAYLVAFDLDRFELGFAVGTEHPQVYWSDRVPPVVRDTALPGPDGIGDIEPLVATGLIGAAAADRAVATFTAGFKRRHGGFKSGDLALRNRGSHYGFIDNGVVLSKLQPGLATILALDDGSVRMKTWTAEDDALLERIRFARQNGVPIIEPDPERGEPVPGRLVGRWRLGNWSGSQDEKFRTLRAGTCLQEPGPARFLIYGYFSSATPSAMARVFEAYDCRYAMQLDINALEHTYLAVYRLSDGELAVQHLIEGMNVLDQSQGGQTLPRFLGFADNRDFFYLLKREAGAQGAGEESG